METQKTLARRRRIPTAELAISAFFLLAAGCGSSKSEPLEAPFKIVYLKYGGMPGAPDPNTGATCNYSLQLTATQDQASMLGFCSPEEANRIYINRSFSPNETTLTPLQAAWGKVALDGNVNFPAADASSEDGGFFDLTVTSSKLNFAATGQSVDVKLPAAVSEAIGVLEGLPYPVASGQ